MPKNDGKFLGWLLLGLLGYGVIKATARLSIEEGMKKAILSQATLPEIRKVVAELTKGCGMDEICRIEKIYRFVVDQIDYMPDPWDEDYFAEALETIYVGAGDCDCKCILLATLLRANGFRVAFDFTPGHVLVEAYVKPNYVTQIPTEAYARPDPEAGGVWILLESTAAGAQIGWVSDELYVRYLSSVEEIRFEI
jgi:hypothetical protein